MKIKQYLSMAAIAMIATSMSLTSCKSSKSSDDDDNDSKTETKGDTANIAVVDITEKENMEIDAAIIGECDENGVWIVENDKPLMDYLASNMVSKPVVIDFSATWCVPCKNFRPVFDSTAKEYQDRVEFYAVDIDQCPTIKNKLGISAVPTLLFYKPGEEPQLVSGAMDADQFKKAVESLL